MKKYLKTLLLTFILVFTFSIVKVHAAFLTIDADNTRYDKNTNKFTISGTSSYNEVMVSIFDSNNQLMSFRTVSSSEHNYSAVFNIIFNEDQTVIVKVGDISENDHDLLNVDVEKSSNPYIQTLEEEGSGNKLTLLDPLKHFQNGDELRIDALLDLDGLDEDSKQLLSAYQNKLGSKRKIVGLMKVEVYNNGNQRDTDETDNGYKLFLKADESMLSAFTKPYIARITDPSVIGYEDARLLKYSSEEGGIPVLLNNTGIYLLIDDTSIVYEFSSDTKNQTYNLLTDDTLTFKIEADKDKFLKLYIDNKEVDSSNYEVKSGSTIITLKKDYLSKLAVGTHTVYADYTDGYATTSLKVVSESSKKSDNPKTYDNIKYYMAVFVVAGIGLFISFKTMKKNN